MQSELPLSLLGLFCSKWNELDYVGLTVVIGSFDSNNEWKPAFFALSLIIVGTTEKALQFIMPLKSIYNKNLGFVEQKMYFSTLQRGSNNNKSII